MKNTRGTPAGRSAMPLATKGTQEGADSPDEALPYVYADGPLTSSFAGIYDVSPCCRGTLSSPCSSMFFRRVYLADETGPMR